MELKITDEEVGSLQEVKKLGNDMVLLRTIPNRHPDYPENLILTVDQLDVDWSSLVSGAQVKYSFWAVKDERSKPYDVGVKVDKVYRSNTDVGGVDKPA